MVLPALKKKRCRHFRHLWLVKSNLTIFPTSLVFRDISCNFLIMALITIMPLSLSSNKLGNNFNCDTNLLMPKASLLISNKKVLSCNWLVTNNNIWCHQELIMWISSALFEQKRFSFNNLTHVVFWTKGELFYKNPLNSSVLKSQFQNLQNLDKKNWFFHDSLNNNFKVTTERKNYIKIMYAFTPTAGGRRGGRGSIKGTNEIDAL